MNTPSRTRPSRPTSLSQRRRGAAAAMPAAGVRRASHALRLRVAQNVKARRRARGWTQAALAARCGCAANFISDLECARLNLTLASLETLARALGCCESDLLAQRTAAESDAEPSRSNAP